MLKGIKITDTGGLHIGRGSKFRDKDNSPKTLNDKIIKLRLQNLDNYYHYCSSAAMILALNNPLRLICN